MHVSGVAEDSRGSTLGRAEGKSHSSDLRGDECQVWSGLPSRRHPGFSRGAPVAPSGLCGRVSLGCLQRFHFDEIFGKMLLGKRVAFTGNPSNRVLVSLSE